MLVNGNLMYEDAGAKPSTNESDFHSAPVITFHVYVLPNIKTPIMFPIS
jgi:hypothetical protein